MRTVAGKSNTKIMPFAVRPMQSRDIPQLTEIEHEAFPTLLTRTSFRRELRKSTGSYLVAWRRDDNDGNELHNWHDPNTREEEVEQSIVARLIRGARGCWSTHRSTWRPGQQFIVGFLGMWYALDEVHIVSIGVKRHYRGQGVGELLLISAIEQATAKHVRVVTLEVRVSNQIARNLYVKYGFKERGLRKGYYTDDREDAIIKTTDPIDLPSYSEEFQKLVQAHERQWGYTERILS